MAIVLTFNAPIFQPTAPTAGLGFGLNGHVFVSKFNRVSESDLH